jgi:hypothetical protein
MSWELYDMPIVGDPVLQRWWPIYFIFKFRTAEP